MKFGPGPALTVAGSKENLPLNAFIVIKARFLAPAIIGIKAAL